MATDRPLVPQFARNELNRETPRGDWGPILKRIDIARRHLVDGPVLDIGAGTGWLAMHLARWGFEVTAVDYSVDARAAFDDNMRRVGVALSVQAADITALPFADGQFGSVTCYSVLEHVQNVGLAISELARVTRSGGSVIVGVPNGFGAYSLLNDRSPRRGFKRRPPHDNVREYHEHLHGPKWWREQLGSLFDIHKLINLEVVTPLLARAFGYDRTPEWTRLDVAIADYLPAFMASDLIYICRKR